MQLQGASPYSLFNPKVSNHAVPPRRYTAEFVCSDILRAAQAPKVSLWWKDGILSSSFTTHHLGVFGWCTSMPMEDHHADNGRAGGLPPEILDIILPGPWGFLTRRVCKLWHDVVDQASSQAGVHSHDEAECLCGATMD